MVGVRRLNQVGICVNRGRDWSTGSHSITWQDLCDVLGLWMLHAFWCMFDFNSENVLEPTFYRNLEPRTKKINESIDIRTCSGSRDAVNIYPNDNFVVHTKEDTAIERERQKYYTSKSLMELLKPSEWSLVETIESIVESKNVSIKTDTR